MFLLKPPLDFIQYLNHFIWVLESCKLSISAFKKLQSEIYEFLRFVFFLEKTSLTTLI
jgi:hypothetical protein